MATVSKKPVAYLDVDDVLVMWSKWRPEGAPGAREFLEKLTEHYEVRWLTYWAPDGVMEEAQLQKLARIINAPMDLLRRIGGLPFGHRDIYDKVYGINWQEHLNADLTPARPFIWIEDSCEVGDVLRSKLRRLGLYDCYIHCDTTQDPESLRRVHERLFGNVVQQGQQPEGEDAAKVLLSEPRAAGTDL